uniref:Thioredoxin n=1 Tax=Marseillevirus LCMAC202 TaxID=2506606 RepID=A0A481YXW4_9VIRU|nr:MAG: thioredoxin [Marseillevirus LCMAC202]
MSIYYLNAGDFGQEGGHLVANIGGITFVMFHSQRCGHCVNFLPEFKRLPGTIRGVNFGICSVDDGNRVIVQMSQQSTTPIQSVPKFILYNDGIPYVEYSGQRSRQAIIGFLQEIISKLDQKQSFTRPRRTRQQSQQQQTPVGVNNPTAGNSMGGPTRPSGVMGGTGQEQGNGTTPYHITPTTGVKEYETSYGRPYNTLNESDFLEYESAYKQQMQGGSK